MAVYHYPQTAANESLVFHVDSANKAKSWSGAATTNLLPSPTLSVYNNVPSHVSTLLEQTIDTYQGSPVWKLTLTPTSSTGVSYLTAGNNPGIGVVISGVGGGTGGRYTGHSIFFRPTVPMHTSPIFTHYANISGYQSSTNYDNMYDGWYRAHVIWYDSVTRSDGKYWAINPASATLNEAMTFYWAGAFKEDRNDSTHVSAFTPTARSASTILKDMVSGSNLTVNDLSYNTDGSFSFNGTGSSVSGPSLSSQLSEDMTAEVWMRAKSVPSDWARIIGIGDSSNRTFGLWLSTDKKILWQRSGTGQDPFMIADYEIDIGPWYHVVATTSGSNHTIYINGQFITSATASGPWSVNSFPVTLGYAGFHTYFNGDVAVSRLYDRALTADEAAKNFSALRKRFGI